MDNTNFLKLLQEFADQQKEDWHISYNIINGDIVGVHPKDPRRYANRTHIMHSDVRKLQESEMEFLDSLVNGGLNKFCVDLKTNQVKLKPKKISDWGELTRIEFSNDILNGTVDISISILIEPREIVIKLHNNDLTELLEKYSIYEHNIWITDYNDATVIYNTVKVDLPTLVREGEQRIHFDSSHLPIDISMYYLKFVDKIAFEVK